MKKKWILSNCDLDLWPKVINFIWVWDNAVSNQWVVSLCVRRPHLNNLCHLVRLFVSWVVSLCKHRSHLNNLCSLLTYVAYLNSILISNFTDRLFYMWYSCILYVSFYKPVNHKYSYALDYIYSLFLTALDAQWCGGQQRRSSTGLCCWLVSEFQLRSCLSLSSLPLSSSARSVLFCLVV